MTANRYNSTSARDLAFHLHPTTDIAALHANGPLVVSSGKGIFVQDENGKLYLDAMAGLWSASLGFDQPRLAKAAYHQMLELGFYHSFNGKSHRCVAELSEKIIEMAPGNFSKVLFQSSGSEANDAAVKIIKYYNNSLARPAKKKIISRERAYHGVTVASGSLTGLPNFHKAFDLPIEGFLHTDCPYYYREANPDETEEQYSGRLARNLEILIEQEGPETIAAFFAEPVMAAGGVIPPPRGYFKEIQKILKKHDILFVADEVVCGFGRTGNMWGSQTYNINPDMITCAKALSASFLPISALILSEKVYQAIVSQSAKIGIFAHGATYSGHPVCAAVALEALTIYNELNIANYVQVVGQTLQTSLRRLEGHPLVGNVRGVGLMAAVEMVKNKDTKEPYDREKAIGNYFVNHAQENGMITRAVGDIVVISPPLIISEDEIEILCIKVRQSLDATLAFAMAN